MLVDQRFEFGPVYSSRHHVFRFHFESTLDLGNDSVAAPFSGLGHDIPLWVSRCMCCLIERRQLWESKSWSIWSFAKVSPDWPRFVDRSKIPQRNFYIHIVDVCCCLLHLQKVWKDVSTVSCCIILTLLNSIGCRKSRGLAVGTFHRSTSENSTSCAWTNACHHNLDAD